MRSPLEAVARALSMVGTKWPYVLGGGNHRGPTKVRLANGTMSAPGYDCVGLAWSLSYEEPRTVKGFNRGNPKATVVDAINTDSMIEEAEWRGERFCIVPDDDIRVGDFFVLPSIRDVDDIDDDGNRTERLRVGHIWIAVEVPPERPPPRTYADYMTVQCQASTRPAIKRGPGPAGDGRTWRGKRNEAWRIRVLRTVQR